MNIIQLSHYLDQLLDVVATKDSPDAINGLQVENTGEIRKVGLAVDFCLAAIEMAIHRKCNMLFVHHGMFWGGLKPIHGRLYQKLSAMFRANLGLYSAHIPLDMHPILGNNKALADKMGLKHLEPFGDYNGLKIGFKGQIARQSAVDIGKALEKNLGSSVRVIGSGEIQTVGLVSGGAGDILRQAIAEDLDCYVTGEASNHHFHEAMESGCVFILGGHYATETGGVTAVGKHLENQFNIETEFLDYPTGM
ncbi:MAG: Nif3-like dinuclear metal center hexameric protein [Nitrospinae bacterium RIFCSPLOWO2_12_FULL_47_7]|nr:MAG: Nif3-like dinuclear metal center hexameric protein [Nitrospinae bacterium RIFCSPLOWO2_12_FULL_47_7]